MPLEIGINEFNHENKGVVILRIMYLQVINPVTPFQQNKSNMIVSCAKLHLQ